MKKFFSKNGIWILAAATLIAVVLCVLSSMGSTTGFLHNAAGVVTQPFRSAAASVGGWFGSISEHFQSVDTLKRENAELRKKNAELEEQVRQAQTDSEENARLRTLLNLRQQRQDFSFETAHIIERSHGANWSSAMTLSKGTSSDIAIGDCVVNEEGYLVGVITDAGSDLEHRHDDPRHGLAARREGLPHGRGDGRDGRPLPHAAGAAEAVVPVG